MEEYFIDNYIEGEYPEHCYQIKYCIVRYNNTIIVDKVFYNFEFLTFKSKEIREIFLKNNLNLIKQFYEL